jgi:RNA polymerase sigma-70 factor (ECF subfamily)
MTAASAIDDVTLAACQRGDRGAFRQLVLAYQQSVVSLCTAMAGSDGEDLAQETFVRVFSAIRRFDPDGPATLRSWILVIARRLCHDRARRVRHQVNAFDQISNVGEHGAADDPHGDLVRARLSKQVAAAIAALPVEQRVVLALREWEGIEYEEIALIEQIPIGTVRSRLARARESLRQMLSAGPAKGTGDEECHVATR